MMYCLAGSSGDILDPTCHVWWASWVW